MNKYSLAFEPQVQQDLQQAYDYYFYKANFDIAEKFLQHVNSAFDTLEINPFYEIRTKNLRAFPISSFPYIIFFEVFTESLTVEVKAIFNTTQNPNKYP